MPHHRTAALAALLLAAAPAAARAGTFVEREVVAHDLEIFFRAYQFSADANGTNYHAYGATAPSGGYAFPIGSRDEVVSLNDAVLVIRGVPYDGYGCVTFDWMSGGYASGGSRCEMGISALALRGRASDSSGGYAAAEFTGLAQPSELIKFAGWNGMAWTITGPAGIRDVASRGAGETVAVTGVDGYGTSAYTAAGVLKWHAAVDGTRIAVAPDGRVAVLSDGAADVTVTMLGITGTVLWTDTWSRSAGSLEAVARAAFSLGNELYVAGETIEGVFSEAFVLKYSAGGRAWAQTWGAADASESVAALEFEYGTTDNPAVYLTGASVDAAGNSRAYLVKVAKEGVVLADWMAGWLGDSAGEGLYPRTNVNPPSIELGGRAEAVASDGTPMHGFNASFGEDVDGDGFVNGWTQGLDCNDRNAAVHPGATEIVYDGLDNDCDPTTRDDDLDYDGVPKARDCNDLDPRIFPTAIEVALDGVDQNCNGMADDAAGLFSATWTADTTQQALGVQLDAAGNSYVTTDTWPVGAFFKKYDPAGNLLWSVGPGASRALVTPAGVSYVAQALTGETGMVTAFLSRLEPDGTVAWQQPLGFPLYATNLVSGIGLDDAGRLRVLFNDAAGRVLLGFDTNGNPLQPIAVSNYAYGPWVDAPTGDLYVMDSYWRQVTSYGPDGVARWSTGFGQYGARLAIDSARGLVAVGSTLDRNARVDVYTREGALVWTATWIRADAPTAFGQPLVLRFDSGGNLVVAGTSAPFYADAMFLKYDPAGSLLWSLIYRPGYMETVTDMELDEYDAIYSSGFAWDGIDHHAYLVKLSPGGQTLWSQVSAHPNSTINSIAITPGLDVVVADNFVQYSSTGQQTLGVVAKYSQDLDLDGTFHSADCNDFDPAIHPGAVENPYDGVDQNCNGMVDEDMDRDGYPGATDCNDADAAIHPGATEIPYDGIDQNCNGMADDDDLDHDGHPRASDCNEGDATIYVGAPEVKHDGVDQDCNGYDLTIDVPKAHYTASADSLRVEATSTLGSAAGLSVSGRGAMTWKQNQGLWTLSAQPAGGGQSLVTVCGIEGCTTAPVTFFP